MRAAVLRDRVTIQRQVRSRSVRGGEVVEWQDVLTNIAAEVRGLSGLETFRAAQVQSSTNCKIKIRKRAGLTTKMRVLQALGGGSPNAVAIYDIEAILPGENPYLDLWLQCVQRDAEGFRSGGSDIAEGPHLVTESGFDLETEDGQRIAGD